MKKMRKLLVLFMSLAMVLGMSMTVLAEGDLTVTYGNDAKLTSSFTTGTIQSMLDGMQPGDEVTLAFKLTNNSDKSTEWYLLNNVVQKFKDAENGTYNYVLEYEGPDGQKVDFYKNGTVGGNGTDSNLAAVNDTLKDAFHIGTIPAGKTATLTLTVGMDGETNTNAYMENSAQVDLTFYVEPETVVPADPGKSTTVTVTNYVKGQTKIVRTGDNSRLGLFALLLGGSGLVLLLVVFYMMKNRRVKTSRGNRRKENR